MISDQFKKDYRQMMAQGVKFTLEDIIRLNALAVKVRLSQNAAGTTHLPRLAFLPSRPRSLFRPVPRPIILREPTIAHDLWLEQAKRWITIDSNRTFDLLHGFALSRPAEKLPDAFDPKGLIRKVFTFAARELAHLTREQLSAAVDYVLFGADWTAMEQGTGNGERSGAESAPYQPPTTNYQLPSPTIGLLVETKALRLPITLDEAKTMTASELEEAIVRALVKDGRLDADWMRKNALGEYVKARNEVRARKKPTEGSPDNQDHDKTIPCK